MRVQYQGAGGPIGQWTESADSSAIAVFAYSSLEQLTAEVCCCRRM